jgi:hypothetical protein
MCVHRVNVTMTLFGLCHALTPPLYTKLLCQEEIMSLYVTGIESASCWIWNINRTVSWLHEHDEHTYHDINRTMSWLHEHNEKHFKILKW